MVSPDELETIETAADALTPDSVSFLQELIQTPSVNPPGDYEAVVDVIREEFDSRGWDVDIVYADDALRDRLGIEHPRPNVLAYVNHGTGPTITLNAHHDTVPVDEAQWTYAPFGGEVDDGRVWGRGARDSKGRIAAYALVARVLEETGLLPANATIVIAVTADEETGGEAGAGYVVESGALSSDYAIVEGSTYAIEYASSGALHFRVSLQGESSHAGLAPHGGANTLLGASRVLTALEAYGERLSSLESEIEGIGSPTCTPTTIEGGVKTNVVPSATAFTVDCRVPPDFDVDEQERAFRDVVADVALPPGVTVEVETIIRAEPFLAEPTDVHVQAIKRNADAVFGRDIPLRGTRGFSDARFFDAGGAETVKFGPGDEASNAHGPDENLDISQLTDASAAIAGGIVDIAREHASK